MDSLLELLEREKELNGKIARTNVDIEDTLYRLTMLNKEKESYVDKLNQVRGFIKKYFEKLEEV